MSCPESILAPCSPSPQNRRDVDQLSTVSSLVFLCVGMEVKKILVVMSWEWKLQIYLTFSFIYLLNVSFSTFSVCMVFKYNILYLLHPSVDMLYTKYCVYMCIALVFKSIVCRLIRLIYQWSFSIYLHCKNCLLSSFEFSSVKPIALSILAIGRF